MSAAHDDVASQRWELGRASWRRPSDGGFSPASFSVVPLAETVARGFVERHHYSGSFPAARLSFGLLTDDERLAVDGSTVDGRALVGVAVLSVPMRAAVLSNVFPDLEPFAESLELGRLVLTDTPANAESWS
ncbi:Mom family adenine methylcarbamoylation protein [Leifsonia shinshuensis]